MSNNMSDEVKIAVAEVSKEISLELMKAYHKSHTQQMATETACTIYQSVFNQVYGNFKPSDNGTQT